MAMKQVLLIAIIDMQLKRKNWIKLIESDVIRIDQKLNFIQGILDSGQKVSITVY